MRQFFHLIYLCPSLQSRARNMGKIGKVKKEKGLTHSVPLVSFYTHEMGQTQAKRQRIYNEQVHYNCLQHLPTLRYKT